MASLVSGDLSHIGAPEMGSQERSEDGGRWYFFRKEIEEDSPSRRDGIDLKKETYLRKSYCTFLQDLGMRLKVPQVTIATAIIFCHRFYLRQSHAKNDRRTIATACMFLAGKVEETPRPLKDVILVSYEIIHKKDPTAIQKIKQKEVYEQQKELILVGERVVLATLGFDLNVQHPYKPLVEAIKKFKVAQNALAQVAWNFVNDGLRTSLCLQFKPHHIAAGAIFLAAKFLKVKLPSDGDRVWWQEFDVTPRQLEEVSNQMLELYEQNRAPPNQGSEAEGSIAGGPPNRPTPRTSTDEQLPTSNSSQPGLSTNKHDLSNKHASREYGESRVSEPSVYEENSEVQKIRNGLEYNSSEGSKEKISDIIGVKEGDSKDKYNINNVEIKEPRKTQSPSEMIEKIDTNKLKELREKRRKSRADVIRKNDFMDEYDPIVKELEEGVELAIAEKKYNSHNGDGLHVGPMGQKLREPGLENVEEGEVSILEDSSYDYKSPNSNDRKRKAGGPPEKISDGKKWRDGISGEVFDRDHKRHVQENQA